MPSATPAIRYSTVASGTKCPRSIDAPATVLNKISNARWMITCTDCCSATAAVARTAVSPPFCRYRVLSASPPTPAGVVVAAKVLATCTIDSFQKLTDSVGAGPQSGRRTHVRQRRHHQAQQRPPPVRRPQFGKERRHGADERIRDVDQCAEQHQLNDLAAAEPGDRFGFDLVGARLTLHLRRWRRRSRRPRRPPIAGFVSAQPIS